VRRVKSKKPTARPIKPLEFLGSSRDDLAAMPANIRHDIGVELMRVQFGGQPTDFKPMSTVGSGAYEIRVRDSSGAFRAIYVAKSNPLSMCCMPSRKRRSRPQRQISIWPKSATK